MFSYNDIYTFIHLYMFSFFLYPWLHLLLFFFILLQNLPGIFLTDINDFYSKDGQFLHTLLLLYICHMILSLKTVLFWGLKCVVLRVEMYCFKVEMYCFEGWNVVFWGLKCSVLRGDGKSVVGAIECRSKKKLHFDFTLDIFNTIIYWCCQLTYKTASIFITWRCLSFH